MLKETPSADEQAELSMQNASWKELIFNLVKSREAWVLILGTFVLLVGYFSSEFKFLQPKFKQQKIELTIRQTFKQGDKEIKKYSKSLGIYTPAQVYNSLLQGAIYFFGSLLVAFILRIKFANWA